MYADALQSNSVESPPSATETFIEVDGNISRGTAGKGIMSMAGHVKTSVGVGRDVCNKERESQEWKREQETHAR